MIKEQLIQARDLIKQKRYHDARVILQHIDHPTAQEWLGKLNRLAPPPPGGEVVETRPKPDTRPIKAQMLEARDLIIQKEYDAARHILEQIDHPTAKEWLGKLTMLITAQTAPANLDTRPLDKPPAGLLAAHDEILRQAQEALLTDQYDQARMLLEPLNTPEAAFWLEKTGMTRFRTYENIWLDMFRYTLPPEAEQNPAEWTCATCGRGANAALTCPQRDQNPCPVKISTRTIEEPRRLALLLQALYLGRHEDIEKIMFHIETARLAHWKSELAWQLEHMDPVDVRRGAVEKAIPLLDRHVKKRLTESKQAVVERAESRSQDAAQLEPDQLPQPEPTIANTAPRRDANPTLPLEDLFQPQLEIRLGEQIEEPRLKQIVNAIIRFFINQ